MSSESGSDMDFDDYKEFIRENKPEDAEFSDEEDEVLFGQDNRVVYFSKLRPVKHNDTSGHEYLHLEDIEMSTSAWARVGLFLGNNTHLRC